MAQSTATATTSGATRWTNLATRPWQAILVATDGSPDSHMAATIAADLARRTGARLHVAHAWMAALPPVDAPGGYPPGWTDNLRTDAAAVLAGDVTRLRTAGFAVNGSHLVQGRTAGALISLAAEIDTDLIVCGHRGLGAFKSLLLGSVSESLVNASVLPVLVVPNLERAWPPSHVVVGYDGSREAARASEWGARLALALDLPLELKGALWTWPHLVGAGGNSRLLPDLVAQLADELESEALRIHRMFGLPCHAGQVVDEPVSALLGEQESLAGGLHAIVVVGSRGLDGVKRIALGSVSGKVVRAARGPVVVCPRPRPPDTASGAD